MDTLAAETFGTINRGVLLTISCFQHCLVITIASFFD